MRVGYPLEWFDYLITVSLDPKRANIESILPEQITLLESTIENEKIKEQSFLKNLVFSLLDENKISLVIRHYYSVLIILLDQAFDNLNNISADKTTFKQIVNVVILCIEEMLSFIETRFPLYIGMNERVPLSYLSSAKRGVKQRTDDLKDEFRTIENRELTDIVLNTLYTFSNSLKDNCFITFQKLWYVQELLKELEELEYDKEECEIFTMLDKVLIELNFNSEPYLYYITKKISITINDIETIHEKIDYLRFHFKNLNQLHPKKEFSLFPQQGDVKDSIGNWFRQEIVYLESKLQIKNFPLQSNIEISKKKISIEKEKHKVLCEFSTDQLAIALRALDELKVLKARSMNEVFKTIVPHISTPYKKELSYDSVRSKSYAAEERDKKIVIETLQQIIEKVKRY